MNIHIANILKGLITGEEIAAVDAIFGLVITEKKTVQNGSGGSKEIRFPVDWSTGTAEPECDPFTKIIAPNDKYRSLIYFEQLQAPAIIFSKKPSGNNHLWETKLRLVCWMNTDLLDASPVQQHNLSSILIHNIVSCFPMQSPINNAPYSRVRVTGISSVLKTPAIFSGYTYDEDITKYLTFPFDYFAIDITVQFALTGCEQPELTTKENDC